ncbi:MAG TPA: acyl carrier protein [Puia sp.]|nr:acyl carrier protein [Puia sp.]
MVTDMSAIAIDAAVRKLISEKLGYNESVLGDHVSFKDDLATDSLDLYELIMELEKAYGIQIPDEEAEKLTTVGAVIRYIRNKK